MASRILDVTAHSGVVLTGSADVHIGFLPAARVSDGHFCPLHSGGPVAEGAPTVFINGLPAARVGDRLTCTTQGPPSALKVTPLSRRSARFDLTLAEGSGEVATFLDGKGRLLAVDYKAELEGQLEVNGLRDLKMELAAKGEIRGSVVSIAGATEGALGSVSGRLDLLTVYAETELRCTINTSTGEASLKAAGGVGGAVVTGRLEGETKAWKIPFTTWEIGATGAVEGSLLAAEAKGHAELAFSRKDGLRLGAGGKVGAFLAGLGAEFSIFIRPQQKSIVIPDILVTGWPTVIIGNATGKAERLQQRRDLIADARARAADPSLPPEERAALLAAADRLEQDNLAVERARLSEHVYTKDQPMPPRAPDGWSELSADELRALGVDPDSLVDPKGGFKSAIYRSDLEDPPKIIIAFAGTDAEFRDIWTDAKQAFGLKDGQYERAKELTQTVALAAEGSGYVVETTGHSLGAGMGSGGAAVAGVRATTFNAAGLHKNTTKNLSAADRAAHEKNVKAYVNKSDPLNILQDATPLPDAYGERVEVDPVTPKRKPWELLDKAMDGHGIGPMIDAIEARKAADIATMGGTP